MAAANHHEPRGSRRLWFSLVALGFLAAAALWIVPILQVEPARDRLALEDQLAAFDRLTLENQWFQAENGARATLAIILGAAGMLLASGIIWRRYEISRELKTHERLARAVEQLGSDLRPATAVTASVAPTPAARRTPTVRKPAAPPPPPLAEEPKDNVVRLNPPSRRPGTSRAKTAPAEAKPKKSTVAKHRKPGLVNPA